ncbi:MAG: ADOP family duplicated permease [Candidatus Rokuibacteriota bacterium]
MARFLNLFRRRRDRLERDLDRELQYHVDRRANELTTAGLTEADARRRARIELGGVAQVQEAVRDAWTHQWLDAVVRDVRYAMRTLRKSWGFTLGAGAVLALTIGANVAIFSVVNSVLLQPLPYPDAGRLVSIETVWTNTGRASLDVSGPDFHDWRARSDVFETMAAYSGGDNTGDNTTTRVGDRAVLAHARFVSEDFFALVGQAASAGRLLTEKDIPPEGPDPVPAVAVVAHRWAVTHFGSAQAALGQNISRSGRLEIVGVAAPEFSYPRGVDLWIPFPIAKRETQRGQYNYRAVARLKPGVGLARAQAQMRTIGEALARQYPEDRLKAVRVLSLHERVTGNLQATLWILMAAVAVVWVIGCVNIANLLLARASNRMREMALRAALGAGRGRVIRQLLTESCVLAGAAALTGLVLASMLVQGVVALAPADLPRLDEVRMDVTVVLFALGLSLVSTMIFGLVPALHVSRLDLSDGLKQGGSKATGARTATRLRSALVVAEVALSVVLLAAAGLLLRSFQALQDQDLGFTTERVLVANTEYPVGEDGAEIPARIRFYQGVLDRLRAVPGVHSAAGAAYLGMGREPRAPRDYFIEGQPERRPGERPQAEHYAITSDYFKTLAIPVLAGRDFAPTDTTDRPGIAIINQTLARVAFPGESPLGKRLRISNGRSAPWMEIVGVVGDTRWQDPMQPAPPAFFTPSTQGWGNSLAILARTSVDERSLVSTLRTLLNEADPTVPIQFETLEELFGARLTYPRFRTQVIGLFAGVAALLAAVGIFSVLAYLVGQRTRELAVRRALGASAANVIGLIMAPGLRLVAAGLVLGLAGATASARLLSGLLYEITPWDVRAYVGTIAVLSGVALLAILVPGIRAATIPPVTVLQQE